MINLKEILNMYPNCLNSRTSFKSVLMDKYPTEKRMINIVTILFECGIANQIKAKSSINADEMQKFLTQIENEYGISAQYSQEAIMIWAAAFDITVSVIKKTQMVKSASVEIVPQPENKPVVYVQGDINDYDVEQKADGYYITHFNGFEEEEMTIPSMIDGKPIKGIGEAAFQGCVTVKRIHVSEGVEVIENRAFKDCRTLELILLPDTLRRIGDKSNKFADGAFVNTNLQKILIPGNVEFIGPSTFYFCTKLQNVELSDKITVLCDSIFRECKMLSEIKLPSKLLIIEKNAFKDCKNLHKIHIPFGTQTIGEDVFRGCKLNSIYIPPTVTKIWGDKCNSIFDYSMFGDPTIYCTAGSVAMEYARKYRLKCAKAQF